MWRDLLDIRTRLGTPAYLTAMAGLYFSQPLYVLAVAYLTGRSVPTNGLLWFLPFRELTKLVGLPTLWVAGGLILSLVAAAGFAFLSFRRIGKAGEWAGWAAFTIVPLLQIVAVAWVAILPLVLKPRQQAHETPPSPGWWVVTEGVLAGVGVLVFAVVVSTLVFGVYGFGLFIAAPLLVGFTTGYLANRREELSEGRTALWVTGASALGAAMLMIFGLEGAICLLLATPITAIMAIAGGAIGRAFARAGKRTRPTAMSLAVLPLAFAAEAAIPARLDLESREAVMIAAPPQAVWDALVEMGEIAPAPSLPFRVGLAYPVRAAIHGEGVGARRIGGFSTGIATERVTAWEPGRRLAFAVLTNPPAMRELSPHPRVYAPHVKGYFETRSTSFDLAPLPDGRTRLTLSAQHRLRLDPAPYWEPMTRWVIRANSHRVLAHVRRTAEASVARVQPSP